MGLIAIADYVTRHCPWVTVRLTDFSEVAAPALARHVARLERSRVGSTWYGISATTASYAATLATATNIKGGDPEAVVVVGGPHVSAQAPLILERHPQLIDYAVRGEGERAMVALLQHYPEVDRVPGLVYRGPTGVCSNEPSESLGPEELDRVPVTFHGAGLDANPGKFGTVTYVSARGCPLRCAFCSVANEVIRHKSIERVVEDLRSLRALGYRRIAIEDNFFAHSALRTRRLCEQIAKLQRWGTEFAWDCQTRVESLAIPGLVEAMDRANCEAVYIGVESVVPRILLYLRKTARPERYLQTLAERSVPRLLASRIACHINLQLGVPGETREDIEATLAYLGVLGAQASAAGKHITVFPMLHVVYPGTEHFSEGVRGGRFRRDVFEDFTAWEATQEPVLTWLGEHFAHGTGGLPEGVLATDALRAGEFRFDLLRVGAVDDALRSMARIRGIKVFKYGAHLVGSMLALAKGGIEKGSRS